MQRPSGWRNPAADTTDAAAAAAAEGGEKETVVTWRWEKVREGDMEVMV